MRDNAFRMTTAALGLTAALLLGACGTAEKAINPGGDTKCSDYVNQDTGKKRVTVTKFLEQQRNGRAPTDQEIDTATTTVDLMCQAQRNPDTPIKNADLTGVFVPK
ncbi:MULTISPECIES: hypothetical protein [unclassified Nocardia]|uniref:hypothetical protein n=1 Tax=unclassified Nocardia TaxID=2637762 RepID=UPI001CE4B0B4|nr:MULTISPECIES: hypothetical protein [unclassified Nocardia]